MTVTSDLNPSGRSSFLWPQGTVTDLIHVPYSSKDNCFSHTGKQQSQVPKNCRCAINILGVIPPPPCDTGTPQATPLGVPWCQDGAGGGESSCFVCRPLEAPPSLVWTMCTPLTTPEPRASDGQAFTFSASLSPACRHRTRGLVDPGTQNVLFLSKPCVCPDSPQYFFLYDTLI